MSFVTSEPSGDPSPRDPESELTPPGGTPAAALLGDTLQAAKVPATETPEPPPAAPAFSFAGSAEHNPWPFGVADAAAEFRAMQAETAAPPEPVEPARSPEAALAASESTSPALEPAVEAHEPVRVASPEPEAVVPPEAVVSPEPIPVAALEPVWAAPPEPEPVAAPAPIPSPEPMPVAAPEPAVAELATRSESDPSDGMSVEWVPADSGTGAAVAPAVLEPPHDEPANSAQTPADGGGYIERYQRLFLDDAADPERAILAAIDAVIQGPAAEAPREEAPVPVAAAPVVAAAAPMVSQPAEPTADSAPGSVAPPTSAEAPVSTSAPSLDIKQDVDWSEEVLAAAARAAQAAGERARTQQRAAAVASAQRVAATLPAQNRAREPSLERAAEAVSTDRRAARHKARKARRARFAATPLFLFAFVGSVMVALGVGFVTGFMIGRETPRAAEASPPRPAEPAAVPAEPAASAAEAPPSKRQGAIASRVEGVVPQGVASAELAPGAVLSPAAAKLARGPFDPKAAGAAVSKAAARAGICVQPGDAGGEAVVTVTLDPSGVTSSAAVYGARFSGTQAGECIAGLLRDVKVRPFRGEPVTVKKTIQVQ